MPAILHIYYHLQIVWLSTTRRGLLSMRNAAAKLHWQHGWPPHWRLGAECTACTWTVLSWQAMQLHLFTKPLACGWALPGSLLKHASKPPAGTCLLVVSTLPVQQFHHGSKLLLCEN